MLIRFLLCISLTVQIIQGKTEEEIRTWYSRQALECKKDHPVSAEEMQMMQNQKSPNSKNAKCLLLCVFKKGNLMDDKGMFDAEKATSEFEKNYEGDDTKVEKSKNLFEICKKVNSEPVGDGDAGCDRALHLFNCFHENGPKMGFKMHNVYDKVE